jgi:hypothetical protein
VNKTIGGFCGPFVFTLANSRAVGSCSENFVIFIDVFGQALRDSDPNLAELAQDLITRLCQWLHCKLMFHMPIMLSEGNFKLSLPIHRKTQQIEYTAHNL